VTHFHDALRDMMDPRIATILTGVILCLVRWTVRSVMWRTWPSRWKRWPLGMGGSPWRHDFHAEIMSLTTKACKIYDHYHIKLTGDVLKKLPF
jgi:hypothetical protein